MYLLYLTNEGHIANRRTVHGLPIGGPFDELAYGRLAICPLQLTPRETI